MRSYLVAAFALFGANAFAQVSLFEKGEPGVRKLVIERYIRDEDNLETEYLEETITKVFDKHGDLMEVTHDVTGKGKTVSIYSHNHDINGKLKDVSEKDGEGHLVNKWTYQYSADGALVLSVRRYKDGKPADDADVYKYDKKGNPTETTLVQINENSKKTSKLKISYKYKTDDAGRVVEAIRSVNGREELKTTYAYTGKGELKKRSDFNLISESLETEVEYNSAGDMISKDIYDHYGMEIVEGEFHDYEYSENNRKTEDSWMYGKLVNKFKMECKHYHDYYKYEEFAK